MMPIAAAGTGLPQAALSAAAHAFAIRKQHFPDEIFFHAPGLRRYETLEFRPRRAGLFVPVSLTGGACALQCDHCAARVLEPMVPARPTGGLFETGRRLYDRGARGLLVSGGSDRDGKVPHVRFTDDMRRLKTELGMRIIVHSGLVDEPMAAALAEAGVDGVMLDVIGANETIRQVYHLDVTVEAYDRSLALLTRYGHTVLPHIVMGLHYGKFLGEQRALDMIRQYPVHALILVVLTPLVGTAMEGLAPPAVEDVAAFFGQARTAMPATKVMLGCARPLGALKQEIDRAAVDNGLNGIAYPAEGIVQYARERGLMPRFYDTCCSITWDT